MQGGWGEVKVARERGREREIREVSEAVSSIRTQVKGVRENGNSE